MSKLLKEQWSKLAFGKRNTSINESLDPRTQVDHIVQNTIEEFGAEVSAPFYNRLARAQSHDHFLAMFIRNEEMQDTFADFSHECNIASIDIISALGYIREKYAVPHEIAQTKADQAAEPEMGYSDFNPTQWYDGSL